MEILKMDRDYLKKLLIEAGATEDVTNILEHIYSIKLKDRNIKVVFNDSEA